MKQTIRVSVDDHSLLRHGLVATINDESDMKMVAEAGTGLCQLEDLRDIPSGRHHRLS